MKEQTGSPGPDRFVAERVPRTERRRSRRWRVGKSVRICPCDTKLGEEIEVTRNASPDGVYFTTQIKHYYIGMILLIAPIDNHGHICGSDYVAEVLRIDPLPDGNLGIATRFHT